LDLTLADAATVTSERGHAKGSPVIQPRVIVASVLLIASASLTQADILRWDNGQIIPGTEEITLGPRVQLNDRELEFAELSETDLTGADFTRSNLIAARFSRTKLAGANFSGANLSRAWVDATTFWRVPGFTKEHLYSTASYQAMNLRGFAAAFSDFTK
jgi:uncharacterized protein YjbI with pentapeptide repeats